MCFKVVKVGNDARDGTIKEIKHNSKEGKQHLYDVCVQYDAGRVSEYASVAERWVKHTDLP